MAKNGTGGEEVRFYAGVERKIRFVHGVPHLRSVRLGRDSRDSHVSGLLCQLRQFSATRRFN